jgi:hypothetical protein
MAEENSFNPYYSDMGSKVSGATSSIASAVEFGQDLKGEIDRFRDAEFQEADTMVGGLPSYAGVSYAAGNYRGVKGAEAGKGLIGKGALTGAGVGATVGSFIGPWGTLIGAAAGAIVGTVTGIFGKKAAKREQVKAVERAGGAFRKSQSDYTEDVEDYYGDIDTERQAAQQERSYQRRLYGTNITDPFASII